MEVFWVFIAWSLWFTIAWFMPAGGLLGDVIFRISIGNDFKDDLWTFAISWIPIVGPLVSSIVLLKHFKCKHD